MGRKKLCYIFSVLCIFLFTTKGNRSLSCQTQKQLNKKGLISYCLNWILERNQNKKKTLAHFLIIRQKFYQKGFYKVEDKNYKKKGWLNFLKECYSLKIAKVSNTNTENTMQITTLQSLKENLGLKLTLCCN